MSIVFYTFYITPQKHFSRWLQNKKRYEKALMVTKKTDHTHVKLFFVEMYRLSIVIGVIIVVLLASPVPCVRGKPPECWGVIPGVVTCDCSIIGFMANYGFNKL